MVKVDYDQKWDILYVYKEGEKAKFSIEALENFVIDIGFDGKVVGLEIQNASKTLKVAKNELKNIKKAKIATFIKNKIYGVICGLQLEKTILESELQLPTSISKKI
jgi:uncharacterized protein YuzE